MKNLSKILAPIAIVKYLPDGKDGLIIVAVR